MLKTDISNASLRNTRSLISSHRPMTSSKRTISKKILDPHRKQSFTPGIGNRSSMNVTRNLINRNTVNSR